MAIRASDGSREGKRKIRLAGSLNSVIADGHHGCHHHGTNRSIGEGLLEGISEIEMQPAENTDHDQ